MSPPSPISRRRALQSLAGASLSISIVSATTGEPTVDIPKLAHGDQVLEYLSVPADWNQHRTTAKRTHRRFGKNYAEQNGVFSIGLRRSTDVYGGVNGLQIHVRIDPQKFQGVLPEQYDGIPVTVSKEPERHGPGSHNNYDSCHNQEGDLYVRGGEYVGCPETGDGGTACCPVTYDGDQYLLHCSHVFWDDCDTPDYQILGRKATVYDGDVIGQVVDVNKSADIVRILLSDDASMGGIDDNKYYPDVMGHVTESTLDYWVSNGGPDVYNMGVNTGLTSGQVNETHEWYTNDCVDFDGGYGVGTFIDFGRGDSGGPTYHYRSRDTIDAPEGAYMISCTTHGYYYLTNPTCGGTVYKESAGTGAYHLNDKGYTFGSGFPF